VWLLCALPLCARACVPCVCRACARRWLEYEQAHGSERDVAAVREKARAYMEAQGA
jgi:hypothetical protein